MFTSNNTFSEIVKNVTRHIKDGWDKSIKRPGYRKRPTKNKFNELVQIFIVWGNYKDWFYRLGPRRIIRLESWRFVQLTNELLYRPTIFIFFYHCSWISCSVCLAVMVPSEDNSAITILTCLQILPIPNFCEIKYFILVQHHEQIYYRPTIKMCTNLKRWFYMSGQWLTHLDILECYLVQQVLIYRAWTDFWHVRCR